MANNEVSYRITSPPAVIIHDNTVPVCTKTDFHEATPDDDLNALQTQFVEFKRYTFDELAAIRSKKSADDNENNYVKPLLRSMEHRMISLERQLENKQRIIEKLIAGPKQIYPEVNTAPMGIRGNETKEKKLPQRENETRENKGNRSTSKSNNGCVSEDKDAMENVNNKNIVFEGITIETDSSSKNKQQRASKRKRQAQKRKNIDNKMVAD